MVNALKSWLNDQAMDHENLMIKRNRLVMGMVNFSFLVERSECLAWF